MQKTYKELLIWQKADKIYDMVCHDIGTWPHEAIANSIKYQLLDSSSSISSNIAEGYGRGSPREFEQFIRYSRGSLSESDNWLFKAMKREFISVARYEEYAASFEELKRMIASFISSLRKQKKRS